MSKSAWTAWAVKNSVVMLCFAALAIHFNHWWIVLFAAFFMSSLERKSPAKPYITHDKEKASFVAMDFTEVPITAGLYAGSMQKEVLADDI